MDQTSLRRFEKELRFAQKFFRQIGPAIYNVYLLRRVVRRTRCPNRISG